MKRAQITDPQDGDILTYNLSNDRIENTSPSGGSPHNIASHTDTTVTGAQLNALVGGGETDLHSHAGGSLELGETDSTAYRGDRGKTAYDHSQVAHAPSGAQANADITKGEIEAKLTGEIDSHTHASSASALPWAQYTKSSSVNQDVGGNNGTVVYWTWDGEDYEDATYFTHAGSSAVITVEVTGWYHIKFQGNAQQTGGARATLEGVFRINGGDVQAKGTRKNYTRGANYGNFSPGLDCRVYLTADDTIEVGSRIEDTDDTATPFYVFNTNGAEIGDDETLLLLEYIGT